jgi:hypothetical protein
MKEAKKLKCIVIRIARADIVDRYPEKYIEDTKRYPVLQNHLGYKEDDNIFIIHEDAIDNIIDEQDFITADDFFNCVQVESFEYEPTDSEDFMDAWIDKYFGVSQPVGTTRDRRIRDRRLAEQRLMKQLAEQRSEYDEVK